MILFRRAQRLSASLEPSLSRRLLTIPAMPVLNAFRHHWNPHSVESHLVWPGSGAQRLSASLEPSPEVETVDLTPVSSAQRLSASLEPSLRRADCGPAFRPCAQRLSASLEPSPWRGSSNSSAGALVLNAFRHHWNPHFDSRRPLSHQVRCSTPFGIIGTLTYRRR